MESKTPFILGLIGVIVSAIFLIFGIIGLFAIQSLGASLGLDAAVTTVSTLNIVLWVIGLVVLIVNIVFLFKIKKEPTRTNAIIFTVASAVGLFTGHGLGAILALIGGIIGIVKFK